MKLFNGGKFWHWKSTWIEKCVELSLIPFDEDDIVERFEITILTKTHFFQMVYNTRHNSKTLGMIFRCINAFPDWAFAISSFFYVSPRNMTLPQYDHQNQQLKDSKWKHSIIWHRFPREYDKKNCKNSIQLWEIPQNAVFFLIIFSD